jgi:hypothetical protein
VRFKERQLVAQAQLTTAWTPPDAVKALNEAKQTSKKAQATLASTERQRKAAVTRVRDSLNQLVKSDALPTTQMKATAEAARHWDNVLSDWEAQRAILEAQRAILEAQRAILEAQLEALKED